jgi:hypothetical protein
MEINTTYISKPAVELLLDATQKILDRQEVSEKEKQMVISMRKKVMPHDLQEKSVASVLQYFVDNEVLEEDEVVYLGIVFLSMKLDGLLSS